jgi:hypothetical protein
MSNQSSIVDTGSNSISSVFSFIEVMGTVSGKGFVFGAARYINTGLIEHLGYNGLACTASQASVSNTRVSKIYVGPGESQAGDQAILDLYLADTDWSPYSYKLGTWWEYKQTPRLPNGYQRLAYLWADNAQSYIDTGVPGNNDNLRFQIGVIVNAHTNYGNFFGNYINDSTNCWRAMSGTSNTAVWGTTNKTSVITETETASVVNRLLEIDLSLDTLIVNGVTTATVTATGNVNNSNILLGRSGQGTITAVKRIYYFKVYDNGVLIRDYAPALRTSDSVVGFYDTVNNTFKPSEGTTDFRAGVDFVYWDD